MISLDDTRIDSFARCPETTEPDCPACPVQKICARETALFQPVLRTTAY
jgi:hypothetical protein